MIAVLLLTLQAPALSPAAQVVFKPITEMSGMVASRRFPGVFWVHNDSGDRARFFAVDRDGDLVSPGTKGYEGIEVEGAKNVDWEDIATDGRRLFLGDVGNNGNARRDLCVYAVDEPDPRRTAKVRVRARYEVYYPDQRAFPPKDAKEFDCEAVFWLRKRLYFLTKHRMANGFPLDSTKLYRLDSYAGDRPNRLTFIERREDMGGWVTAADVSPDGKTLAVLTHFPVASVRLFDATAPGDRFLSRPLRTIPLKDAGQCESLAFDGARTVVVGNEGRGLFRVGL